MVEGEVGAMISADGSVVRSTPVVEAGAPQAPRGVGYYELGGEEASLGVCCKSVGMGKVTRSGIAM